jgi:ribosome biogenesis GTPase
MRHKSLVKRPAALVQPLVQPQGDLVTRTHGRHVWIEKADGSPLLCYARGKKSEVLVGDRVNWSVTGDGGVMDTISPRKNALFRQDASRTKAFAANIDQVLLLLAAEPVFSQDQLMRTLIAAHAAGIPVTIGLNKRDLPRFEEAYHRLQPYQRMGYQVLSLSILADPVASSEELLKVCTGCATLVIGPSGSGKSSLINLLVPQAHVHTQSISHALNTGKHTTTTTTWHWINRATHTALIDSAGFTVFGLHHLDPSRLATYLPDFAPFLGHCRFYNCSHVHEPGCAVLAAVGQSITLERHRLYVQLRQELSKPDYRGTDTIPSFGV